MNQSWVTMIITILACYLVFVHATYTDATLNMGDFQFEAVSRSNCPSSKYLGLHPATCSTAPTTTLLKKPFPWTLSLNNTSGLSGIQATCSTKTTKTKTYPPTPHPFQHPNLSGSRKKCNLIKPTFISDTAASTTSPFLWKITKVKGTDNIYTIQLTARSKSCQTRYLGARPSKSCNKADGIRLFNKRAGVKTHWRMTAITLSLQERASLFLKTKTPTCTPITSSPLLESPFYTNMMETLLQHYYTKVVTCPRSKKEGGLVSLLVQPTYFAQIVSACRIKGGNTVAMLIQVLNVKCPSIDGKNSNSDGLLLSNEDMVYGIVKKTGGGGRKGGGGGEVMGMGSGKGQEGIDVQRASIK